MSKEKKDNDALKKFLSPGNLPADDFEKEALEGFAMLDNEQEALALKQELDNEIKAKLFVAEKRPAAKIYWLAAAAGLVLLIGLGVYFTTGTTNTITKNNNLAITTIEAPDEIRAAPKDPEDEAQAPAINRAEKKAAPLVNETYSPAETGNSSSPPPPLTSRVKAQSARNMQADAPAEEKSMSSDMAMEPLAETREESESAAGVQDTVAMANGAKDKKLAPAAEVPPVLTSSNAVVFNNTGMQTATLNNMAATMPAFEIKGPAVTYIPSPAAKPAVKFAVPACYYTGGEDALRKDLLAKLGAKNISQKFNATLFINDKKAVEQVKITRPYNLSPAQQAQVIEILRSLNKFNFTAKPRGLAEYKIVYNP